MEKLRRLMSGRQKILIWFRVGLLAVSWIVLFSSAVYADDCTRDITRAED